MRYASFVVLLIGVVMLALAGFKVATSVDLGWLGCCVCFASGLVPRE
jgi:drug/metabolite transporter (DMT)-like permease